MSAEEATLISTRPISNASITREQRPNISAVPRAAIVPLHEESCIWIAFFRPPSGIPLLKPGPLLRRYPWKNVVFLQGRKRF